MRPSTTMIPAGETLAEAKRFARDLSKRHAGQYVTLFACFGIFATRKARLDTMEPSSTIGGAYWLNGREKPFTEAQVVADQNATPMMS